MNLKDLETRIDQLIAQTHTVVNGARIMASGMNPSMDETEWSAARAGALSFLERIFGKSQTFYVEFQAKVDSSFQSDGEAALGILRAAQDEIKGGWIQTTKGLVSAEVFSDFLEMAEHLLDQHYKDAAAVIIGSVLEEHLRQLCPSVKVALVDSTTNKPRKAEALNTDLCKATKYNLLDQKQVTTWLDLRNKAAHGKYGEYDESQVRMMLVGVNNFMTRVRQ